MQSDDFRSFLGTRSNDRKHVFSEYCVGDVLDALNANPERSIQSYKSLKLSQIYDSIFSKYGIEVYEDIRKMVMAEATARSWNTVFSNKYPESIQLQFKRTFDRFLETCGCSEGWGKYDEDVYWKDLAMARRRMFPAGAQIVETYSGFSIRAGLTPNVYKAAAFLAILCKSGGRKGFYQIHTHIPDLPEFNEEGWNRCYVRIAEMLENNRDIKGFFGGSWFYDPQLESISPNLMYLQRIPLENGARIFHTGEDNSGNAIAKSKTRRRLFDEGKYIPQSYLLIWPRKELLRWANEQT